jgi:dTDP-4-amino-4,6-dideoxygalactose transaminase
VNPHQVTRDFEAEICRYTGARYAVSTTSCSTALLMAAAWFCHKSGPKRVSVPRQTYCSVPMSMIHAGHTVEFRDDDWQGEYRLDPLPLWDSARRLRAGMFRTGAMQCLSLHVSKHLGLDQGGIIIHNNAEADPWLRRMRFDGRTEGVPAAQDDFTMLGIHAYLSPNTAALGLWKLSHEFPRDNADLPKPEYPDLSKFDVFRKGWTQEELCDYHSRGTRRACA